MSSQKRAYAVYSFYGSPTSYGFSNDKIVLVFDSKKTRDEYIDKNDHKNLSLQAIKRNEVTSNAANYSITYNRRTEPRPFSGEYWGITKEWGASTRDIDTIPGCIGEIIVADPDSGLEPFYK